MYVYKCQEYTSPIYAGPIEAASYDFALNSKRSCGVKCMLAIGAFVTGFFCGYKIARTDIENLVGSNPNKYARSYFVRSLEKRGIKLFMTEVDKKALKDAEKAREIVKETIKIAEDGASENLSANLEKYKDHFKVVVDGDDSSGKSSFINAIMKKTSGDIGAACSYGCSPRPKGVTEFYELNKSVVLCKLPIGISKECFTDTRFDKFDAVVILGDDHDWTTNERNNCSMVSTMAMAAQKANKPYLIVKSKMDVSVLNYKFDHNLNMDTESVDSIISKRYENNLNVLEEEGVKPSNGKLLCISVQHVDKYDFKEVEQLIKNKDFSHQEPVNLTV
ncbi:MAG: hypothetical protein KAG53_00370 [Endozoicomonadaceae bacterium]|nr:hypothetical protein [Endozoicomonadaceae bacterium]